MTANRRQRILNLSARVLATRRRGTSQNAVTGPERGVPGRGEIPLEKTFWADPRLPSIYLKCRRLLFFSFCNVVSSNYPMSQTVGNFRLHKLPPRFPLPSCVPLYKLLLFCFDVVYKPFWTLNATVAIRFSPHYFSSFSLQRALTFIPIPSSGLSSQECGPG